jgi:hypothetical protein
MRGFDVNRSPLFRNNAFTPDEVHALEVAYLNACAAVGATRQPHGVREIVATRILSIAMTGERDATTLYLRFIEKNKELLLNAGEKSAYLIAKSLA